MNGKYEPAVRLSSFDSQLLTVWFNSLPPDKFCNNVLDPRAVQFSNSSPLIHGLLSGTTGTQFPDTQQGVVKSLVTSRKTLFEASAGICQVLLSATDPIYGKSCLKIL